MESASNPHSGTESDDSGVDFDFDWEALTFSANRPADSDSVSMDDWEDRFNQDTSGYVSDPLTTSFTDLDLGPAQIELRKSAEWAELDSWYES